jgi:serine phosphatase RsbU (regulator of sigma subunit)/sugar lactone lactonase YvrE
LDKLLRFLYFFLLLLGLSLGSKGQFYELQQYGSEDGLAGTRVNEICQDAKGHLWIATDNGVSRFDGKKFVNFMRKDGLSENNSTCILRDSKGRIWVGHQTTGLSVIDRDSVWTVNEKDGLSNNEVNDIFEAADGTIWVGTFGGLSAYDGTNWKNITVENGLSSNNIRSIAQDLKGGLWVGTFGAGINVLKDGQVQQFNTSNGLVNNYVTNLAFHRDHMLIGTLGGLVYWKGNVFRSVSTDQGSFNNQVNDVSVNRNGDVWLATFGGTSRLRDGKLLSLTEENGLPSNEVLSVFNDREGNTWLGTRRGLVKPQNLAFAHYVSSDELEIEPTVLFKDSKGVIWAGNETGGALKFDGFSFVRAFEDPDMNDRQISAICEDGSGNLWFGTMDFGGLFKWDRKKLYIYSDEFGLADNNINCLAKDPEGNLIIGTPNGLSMFDGTDFSLIPLDENLAANHVTALEPVKDGVMVGASDGSLFLLKGLAAQKQTELKLRSAVTDICDSKMGLVVATQSEGLFIQTGKSVVHVDQEQGLRASSIRSVAQLGKNLYVGTTQGLQQIWFLSDSLLIRDFDKQASFKGRACKRGAILADTDQLWLGIEGGIARYHSKEQSSDLFEPITFLTAVQLDYQNVDWATLGFGLDEEGMPLNLELQHTQNTIRFVFSGINHFQPAGVRYKWILEGLESDWNPPTDQPYVNYSKLPPGDYTFKLVACNSANICNAEPVSFSFVIKPPIWQTTWFYAIVTLMVIIASYLFVKLREQRLLEEKRILESTVEERTKQLREQKDIVEGQNKHITESIDYAKNIQMAVLPSEDDMKRAFDDHFVLYRPKDTVGGDFYWVFTDGNISWAAAVDCTGHGVAGAFMSMIGTDLLNQIIIEKKVNDPGKVLDELDKGIKLAFAQSAKEFETDQGMDVALVRIDRKKKTLEFAGAQRPLYLMCAGVLINIEGNRHSVSCAEQRGAENFKNNLIHIEPETTAYLFSDGIVDQFGGEAGKKFMIRRLRDFLETNGSLPMKEQGERLARTLDDWKGSDQVQVDDVMLLGIRL